MSYSNPYKYFICNFLRNDFRDRDAAYYREHSDEKSKKVGIKIATAITEIIFLNEDSRIEDFASKLDKHGRRFSLKVGLAVHPGFIDKHRTYDKYWRLGSGYFFELVAKLFGHLSKDLEGFSFEYQKDKKFNEIGMVSHGNSIDVVVVNDEIWHNVVLQGNLLSESIRVSVIGEDKVALSDLDRLPENDIIHQYNVISRHIGNLGVDLKSDPFDLILINKYDLLSQEEKNLYFKTLEKKFAELGKN